MINELDALKSKIEEMQDKRSRLIGQQESTLKSLKDLGYPGIKEAEKALDKMKLDLQELKNNAEIAILEFKEKYPELQG